MPPVQECKHTLAGTASGMGSGTGHGCHRTEPVTFPSQGSGVPTKNRHMSSASIRTKSQTATAADLQQTLKGDQDGDEKGGTLCSGENWQNRSSDS